MSMSFGSILDYVRGSLVDELQENDIGQMKAMLPICPVTQHIHGITFFLCCA